MPAPALTPDQRAQVNAWMAAFRYGGKVDDLSRVDARRNSGQYDDVTWNISLDGATLFGYDYMFRFHLGQALRNGLTGADVERHAYCMTADATGGDPDSDWTKPEWAEEAPA